MPTGTELANPLNQLNVLVELRDTHQTMDRHDGVSKEVSAQCFTRFREDVGPHGAHVYSCVSDGGKTNKNGNSVYNARLPHQNPLLCEIFARGGQHLWR